MVCVVHLLIILCLCVLATSKVTVQGLFAKTNIKGFCDSLFFNALVFLFLVLIFFKDILTLNFSVFLFSLVFGVLTVAFQMCYISAMSCGNVSLTVLIVNLSMIIPILVSVFCYGEGLSVLRFIGILLTVFALFLSIDSKVEKRNFRKWFCLSILSSLFSGGLAVCQKIFSKTEWHTYSKPFVVCGYAVAAIISILIYIIFKCKGTGISYKINIKVIGYAASIGILLGTFQILNTKAITIIDGTLIFPAYYGGALILSYLSSLLILKEKISNKQKLSLAVGVIALVLMNL